MLELELPFLGQVQVVIRVLDVHLLLFQKGLSLLCVHRLDFQLEFLLLCLAQYVFHYLLVVAANVFQIVLAHGVAHGRRVLLQSLLQFGRLCARGLDRLVHAGAGVQILVVELRLRALQEGPSAAGADRGAGLDVQLLAGGRQWLLGGRWRQLLALLLAEEGEPVLSVQEELLRVARSLARCVV